MLSNTACILLLSLAAGAQVRVEISATGSQIDHGSVDKSAHTSVVGETSRMLDFLDHSENPLCAVEAVNCKVPGLQILQPGKFVLGKETGPEELNVGDKIVAVRRTDSAPATVDSLIFFDSSVLGLSKVARDELLASAFQQKRTVVIYRKTESVDQFLLFYKSVINSALEDDDADTALYSAIIGKKKVDPSFIRNIAKAKVDGMKDKFLQVLMADGGAQRFPKFADLLTDPELYKDKKEGHAMKTMARDFRMDRMNVKKEALSKEEARRKEEVVKQEEQEWEAQVNALFDDLPSDAGSPSAGLGSAINADI